MWKKTIAVGIVAMATLWFVKEPEQFPKDGAKGRRVLITGASKGIGEQLAYEYAKHGASVFITARREATLKKVVQKCKELGHKNAIFGYYAADMKDYVKQSKLFVKAGRDKLGGIDTIVVNHLFVKGTEFFFWSKPIDKNLATLEETWGVNMNSYIHIVSHAIQDLKQSGNGRIGIVGALNGKLPTESGATYVASKFALDGFFSSLRLELASSESGLTVTYGAIGGTDTDLMQQGLNKATNWFSQDTNLVELLNTFKTKLVSAQSVAHAMMFATETGLAEIFYPTYQYYPVPFKLIAVIRNIYPGLNVLPGTPQRYDQWEETAKTL